mmetsp:Transcript_19259/g.44049  ORF Transcript_19259/g.44049 Transcript_19259/m.44049 type:complete len:415 (+) Transcript_19259:741-1985(+)
MPQLVGKQDAQEGEVKGQTQLKEPIDIDVNRGSGRRGRRAVQRLLDAGTDFGIQYARTDRKQERGEQSGNGDGRLRHRRRQVVQGFGILPRDQKQRIQVDLQFHVFVGRRRRVQDIIKLDLVLQRGMVLEALRNLSGQPVVCRRGSLLVEDHLVGAPDVITSHHPLGLAGHHEVLVPHQAVRHEEVYFLRRGALLFQSLDRSDELRQKPRPVDELDVVVFRWDDLRFFRLFVASAEIHERTGGSRQLQPGRRHLFVEGFQNGLHNGFHVLLLVGSHHRFLERVDAEAFGDVPHPYLRRQRPKGHRVILSRLGVHRTDCHRLVEQLELQVVVVQLNGKLQVFVQIDGGLGFFLGLVGSGLRLRVFGAGTRFFFAVPVLDGFGIVDRVHFDTDPAVSHLEVDGRKGNGEVVKPVPL